MKTRSKVERYLQQALAPNTRSAYASDLKHFRAWGGRVPATPQAVAQYLADCAGKMKASTLGRRLAAIRHAHVAVGKASPTDSALVKRTLRGIMNDGWNSTLRFYINNFLDGSRQVSQPVHFFMFFLFLV